MRWNETRKISEHDAALYATGADFCRIFKEEMNNLYVLSLLLTADAEKAEQCFVSGLDDCAGANRVFKEWARSWARRMIIQNAIRIAGPVADDDGPFLPAVHGNHHDSIHKQADSILQFEVSAILGLSRFERFAFIISVLEGYSDQETALLLGCSRTVLAAARVRALQQFAAQADCQGASSRQSALTRERAGANRSAISPIPIPLANVS